MNEIQVILIGSNTRRNGMESFIIKLLLYPYF